MKGCVGGESEEEVLLMLTFDRSIFRSLFWMVD